MNKMALKYCFICLVLFGFVITANGGMYFWTDKNGVKHFSNRMPPPEYLQDATQLGEIKYSDDYYKKREAELGLKSQEMNEERRQEKNEEMERKKREENEKATGAELKRRKTVLNSLSDKDDKTQIIKKLGNPSFSSPVHSFKYGPYVSVTEEWLYNNYLGDNRVLVIVIRRNKFQKYYFK